MSVKAQSQTETCNKLKSECSLKENMTADNMFPNGFVQALGKYSNKQAAVILYFHIKHLYSYSFKSRPVSDVVECLKQTFWEQPQKL